MIQFEQLSFVHIINADKAASKYTPGAAFCHLQMLLHEFFGHEYLIAQLFIPVCHPRKKDEGDIHARLLEILCYPRCHLEADAAAAEFRDGAHTAGHTHSAEGVREVVFHIGAHQTE